MKRVYLDTNVLVAGILKEESNSRIILDMVNDKKICAVISDYNILELKKVLRRLLPKADADKRCYLFIKAATLNPFYEIVDYKMHKKKEGRYKNIIVEKDLPHLVIAAEEKTEAIIVKDKHFDNQMAVPIRTPRQFLTEIGITTFEGDL